MSDNHPIGEDDLQAYIDDRLNPQRRENVEAYLSSRPDVMAQIQADRNNLAALRARLAAKATEPVPARLRVRHILIARRRASWRRLSLAAAAIAWLAIGIGIGAWGQARWFSGSGRADVQTAQDAIAAYRIYVSEKLHPVEVGAGQEAHLVQWLSRRVGKPLSAPNLSAQGYQLIGGRLLPAGQAAAAMFMYENPKGVRLTLYAKLDGTADTTAFRFESEGDVSAFSWIDQGLSYVVTARTDRSHLADIAQAVFQQLEATQPRGQGL